jgi:predicted aldo/keto reductase-like oxidoreductase
MRLPVLDGDTSRIDEAPAIRMVRHAVDRGVNYIDTAYPYHGGNSEAFVGRALQDGYREKVKLATKLPTWLVEEPRDFDKFLNEQLKRLQTDQVDENIASAEGSGVGSLTDEELSLVAEARDAYTELRPVACTKCGYCMPCPNEVDIPINFEIYNAAMLFDNKRSSQFSYFRRIPEETRASSCLQCMACEEHCPQEIKISEWMPRIHEELSKDSPF